MTLQSQQRSADYILKQLEDTLTPLNEKDKKVLKMYIRMRVKEIFQ